MEATAPVTVEQAAAVLGISASTVHRRIRSGVLEAEQAERPQGKVWLVHLPPDVVVATGQPSPPIASEATAPTAPISSTPAAEAMVSLIQTTIATVLGPLVTELAASRQVNSSLTDQLLGQAETIGELRAENATLRASLATLDASTATQGPGPSRRPLALLRRLPWIYGVVALLVVLAIVGVLLLLTR